MSEQPPRPMMDSDGRDQHDSAGGDKPTKKRPDIGDEGRSDKQNRRRRSIENARQNVREVRREVNQLKATRRVSGNKADLIYRSAVEDYLMEVDYLMRVEYSEVGSYYWEEYLLGEVFIRCPPEILDAAPDFGQYQIAPGRTASHTFRGLGSLLDAPNQLVQEFQLKTPGPNATEATEVVQRPIPERILKNAFRAINEFCGEAGLDIEYQQDQGDASFDYSELLTNGDDQSNRGESGE